ncbi:MAG: DUF2064 domain-containing protein [Eggerthellaceae bacterium]|nr:DUF2064 domain-containing protein [Eggerthellaceae bacterium]
MRERKNTVLLFSKLPEVGLVKTRLTTLKDGWFEPEVASALYHYMLFDVVEIICAALADLEAAGARDDLHDTYELVISTAPARNLEPMRKLFEDAGTWPREITFINDEGANFDEHYNHAFQQAWDRGADCILSMGADMPALTKSDVKFGFEQLHKLDSYSNGGIVLAPDQEMGVSVVGWTRNTDFSHTGVFYNQTGLTVLPAYIEKARSRDLPVLWLPPIPDVDTMADFYHNVTLVEALSYCAKFDDVCPPWRTAQALEEIGFSHIYVAPNDLRDPRDEIDQ